MRLSRLQPSIIHESFCAYTAAVNISSRGPSGSCVCACRGETLQVTPDLIVSSFFIMYFARVGRDFVGGDNSETKTPGP